MTTVRGMFQQKHYKSDSGWAAGTITMSNDFDVIPANTPCPCTLVYPMSLHGQEILGDAEWREHPRFGRQLCFSVVQPTNQDGLLIQALGSGILPNVGLARAEVIVRKWGPAFVDHMTQNDLMSIYGLGATRAQEIATAWPTARPKLKTVTTAMTFGLTVGQARSAEAEWGPTFDRIIREDPYRLMDIEGFSFGITDTVAKHIGFPQRSWQRVRAAITYAVNLQARNGDTYISFQDLRRYISELFTGAVPAPETWAKAIAENKRITRISEDRFALEVIHKAETALAEQIKSRVGRPVWSNLAALSLSELGLSAEQENAARGVLSSTISVITGPPGSGKTTMMATLLRVLDINEFSIRVVAPTGRAARNFTEKTGYEASTIHMALNHVGDDDLFGEDIFVVEEASMVDTLLMERFLRHVPKSAIVILLGDADQLPSIGPGQVLRDLEGLVPYFRLTTIFRQAQDAGIIYNAAAIVRGEPMKLDHWPDFTWYDMQDAKITDEQITGKITRLFEQGILPKDTTVIAGYRSQVASLNQALQALLNPNPIQPVERLKLAVGDPVRHTQNTYRGLSRSVMNGEVGEVIEINPEAAHTLDGPVLKVSYGDGDIVDYPLECVHLTLAYAITVHASQGGQYPHVAAIAPYRIGSTGFCRRELLYTAITRASDHVHLFGTKPALEHYRRAEARSHRNTLLPQLVRS